MAQGILVDQGLLKQVAREVNRTQALVGTVNATVNSVQNTVGTVQKEVWKTEQKLMELRAYVENMRREQKNAASLQKALTEIIRVRQELEQKYGKYQVVRDTMRGILDATDLGLVTTETISRISEELMIGTPKYWLAPCVVALAAWIANDQDLAKRSIKEAAKRDIQKTSLLMALICRRNGHFEASKEWLLCYFDCQDASNISRSVLLFVNAYSNGIFEKNGEDCDDRCDEFIRNKWLPQLESQSDNFKKNQEDFWMRNFREKDTRNRTPIAGSYKVLGQYAAKQDFDGAVSYLSRIQASSQIASDLSSMIGYKIDPQIIVAQIDEYLASLITDFDDVELNLRKEEAIFTAIKDFNGDEDQANAYLAKKERRQKILAEKISLIEFLNKTVTGSRIDTDIDTTGKTAEEIVQLKAEHAAEAKSEQRLALAITKSYIQESYDKFVQEKETAFPEKIKVKVEDIEYPVKEEKDKASFIQKVKDKLTAKRDAEIAAVKPTMGIFGIVLAVIGAICFFAIDSQLGDIGGVIGAVIGMVVAISGFVSAKNAKAEIMARYETRINNAADVINKAVNEWLTMVRKRESYQRSQRENPFDIDALFNQTQPEAKASGIPELSKAANEVQGEASAEEDFSFDENSAETLVVLEDCAGELGISKFANQFPKDWAVAPPTE